MDSYCAGCGGEMDNLELIECVVCGRLFCEDCLTSEDICFECSGEEYEEYEDFEDEDDEGALI